MNERVRSFIEKYIYLIDDNKFNELYVEAEKYLPKEDIHILTECLIHPQVGCKVLSYMRYVPKYYLATNSAITQIELPDSIQIVRARAFDKCINLEEVILPESIVVVDAYAFANCYSLKKLVVKNPDTSFTLLSTAHSNKVEIYCKPRSKVEKYANEVWHYPVHHI